MEQLTVPVNEKDKNLSLLPSETNNRESIQTLYNTSTLSVIL